MDLFDESEHFGLNCDIERRGRFIGDQNIRLIDQCHRNHNAL
ncbi:Uncharacterised protein [Vibrio cholerae]|nr:Uncharacterised protein [Vibrio cholerae]